MQVLLSENIIRKENSLLTYTSSKTTMNKSGSNTVPCGMATLVETMSEVSPWVGTRCSVSVKTLAIVSTTFSRTEIKIINLSNIACNLVKRCGKVKRDKININISFYA